MSPDCGDIEQLALGTSFIPTIIEDKPNEVPFQYELVNTLKSIFHLFISEFALKNSGVIVSSWVLLPKNNLFYYYSF